MTNKKAFIFAVFLIAASLWLILSVLISLYGNGNSMAGFGGYYLYSIFLSYSFLCTGLPHSVRFFLLKKNFNKNDVVILIMTLVPFFTAGIALRIYLGAGNTSLERLITDSFGPLSPLLLLLLVIIEIILIMHAAIFLRKNPHVLDNPGMDYCDSGETETVLDNNDVRSNIPSYTDISSESAKNTEMDDEEGKDLFTGLISGSTVEEVTDDSFDVLTSDPEAEKKKFSKLLTKEAAWKIQQRKEKNTKAFPCQVLLHLKVQADDRCLENRTCMRRKIQKTVLMMKSMISLQNTEALIKVIEMMKMSKRIHL